MQQTLSKSYRERNYQQEGYHGDWRKCTSWPHVPNTPLSPPESLLAMGLHNKIRTPITYNIKTQNFQSKINKISVSVCVTQRERERQNSPIMCAFMVLFMFQSLGTKPQREREQREKELQKVQPGIRIWLRGDLDLSWVEIRFTTTYLDTQNGGVWRVGDFHLNCLRRKIKRKNVKLI